MINKNRVAVISATGSGKKRTLPNISDSELEIVAIHGRDKEKLAELSKQFGVQAVYTELDILISTARPDFAVVCSPPFLHREQAVQLLQAGIPVLIEKPVAISMNDAQEIARVAEKAGVPVMVAHQLRHMNTYAEIKQTLENGEIGEVFQVLAEWSFQLNPNAPSSAWKLNPEIAGLTSVYDAGVHCLDVLQGLFGNGRVLSASVRQINGWRTYDRVTAVVQYGTTDAVVVVNRAYGPYTNDLVINGTDGCIVARDFFTEASSSVVTIQTRDGVRRVEKNPPSPYGQEVFDFAAVVNGTIPEFDGTTLADALSSLRVAAQIDEWIVRD